MSKFKSLNIFIYFQIIFVLLYIIIVVFPVMIYTNFISSVVITILVLNYSIFFLSILSFKRAKDNLITMGVEIKSFWMFFLPFVGSVYAWDILKKSNVSFSTLKWIIYIVIMAINGYLVQEVIFYLFTVFLWFAYNIFILFDLNRSQKMMFEKFQQEKCGEPEEDYLIYTEHKSKQNIDQDPEIIKLRIELEIKKYEVEKQAKITDLRKQIQDLENK